MTIERINPKQLYDSLKFGFSHATLQKGGKTLHLAGQVGLGCADQCRRPRRLRGAGAPGAGQSQSGAASRRLHASRRHPAAHVRRQSLAGQARPDPRRDRRVLRRRDAGAEHVHRRRGACVAGFPRRDRGDRGGAGVESLAKIAKRRDSRIRCLLPWRLGDLARVFRIFSAPTAQTARRTPAAESCPPR